MNLGTEEIEPLIIKTRTISEGSMVFFDPTKKPYSLNDFTNSLTLTAAQIHTLTGILESREHANEEMTITIAEVRDHLNISEDTMKQRIKALVNMGLLQSRPFQYAHSNVTRKVKVWELTLSKPIFQEIVVEVKPTTTGYDARLMKASEKFKAEFHDVTMPQGAELRIVTPTNNHIIEQLIDVSTTRKKQLVKTFSFSGRKVNALVKSTSRIADMYDFKVYCAVVTLVYHYHEIVVRNYSDLKEPINRTPFHIDDVLKLIYPHRKNFRFSGKDRSRVRGAFQAIGDTIFEIIDTGMEQIMDVEAMGFTKNTAKMVNQLTPFTTEESVIDGDELHFGENATIYIVELQENVFDSLKKDGSLYVLPRSVLGLPPILFGLYLKLRSLAKIPRDTSVPYREFSLALTTLHQSMGNNETFAMFRNSLVNELKSTRKYQNGQSVLKDIDKNKHEILFNLYGFHIVWTERDNKLQVRLHVKEFLACCDITAEKQRAPTMKNKLSDALSPIFALQSSLVRKMPTNLDFPLSVNKYHIDFFVDGENSPPMQFSVYDEKSNFLTRLSDKSNMHIESLAMYLDAKINQLRKLTIKGRELTAEDLNFIDDTFENKHSLTDWVLLFARRRTLHDGLITLLTTGDYSQDWYESVLNAVNERMGEVA
ncbi:replication initiator protein RctB domain-containing protein [Vibrio sp. Hal054]|uniref:replication initiator protein RctB domain-containing protein n=1 Tax=Vibrio sp. Hal054 TaxID=3035158 RepID=UPI00301BF689